MLCRRPLLLCTRIDNVSRSQQGEQISFFLHVYIYTGQFIFGARRSRDRLAVWKTNGRFLRLGREKNVSRTNSKSEPRIKSILLVLRMRGRKDETLYIRESFENR